MARAYTTEILTELGYHVLEASSAAAGLEFLDGIPISTRADLPVIGRSLLS
jgi:hypothetical protein